MKKRLSQTSRQSLIAAAALTVLCGVFALIITLVAAQPDPQTLVASVRNPLDGAKNGVSTLLKADPGGDEYFAANYFPTLNGAKGDGVQNDTKALRESLVAAGAKGGTVYLPQGIYRITEPLTIPAGVTLRGDFSSPDSKTTDGGKTILLVADNQALRNAPLLTLEDGAALMGITVYYEKQTPQNIIEYPASVYCTGAATVRQIALLNAYHGICVTGKGTVDLRSAWISSLDYGLLVTDNNASVSVQDLSVSPSYWLNYAPQIFAGGTGYSQMTEYLHENMHAVILETVADVTLNRISVENAAVGLLFNVPIQRDSLLLASEINVSYTDLPVYLQSLPATGLCFSDSSFRPNNDAGADTVEIGADVNAPVIFSACTFAGQPRAVIDADNTSFISFYHCNFGTWWNVCFDMQGDTFLAVAPTFRAEGEKATLGQNALGVLYNAPTIEESSQLLFAVPSESATQTKTDSVAAQKDTLRTETNARVFYASEYGVSPDAEDNSTALATALAAAAKEHGVVFIAEGTYNFKSIITVPESVRIIGVGSSGKYATTLRFNLMNGGDLGLVELKSGACVENLEIVQASSQPEAVDTFAMASLYSNVRIRRVSITAARGIWLNSPENAVLEHVSMRISQTGLQLQNVNGATVSHLSVTDLTGSYTSFAMVADHCTVTLSDLRTFNVATALSLSGQTNLTGTLLALRGSFSGVLAAQSGNALLTCVGSSDMNRSGSSVFLQGSDAFSGALTVQGAIVTGSSSAGNLIHAQNGTIALRAALITAPYETSLISAGNGQISVFGSIWENLPLCHANATGGSITLAANLLRSDKTFEGISGSYLQTAVTEPGSVKGDTNIIQYTYIEPEEGDGQESVTGSEANTETPEQKK